MTAADESWTKRAHSVHSMGAGTERGARNERAPSMHARLNFFRRDRRKTPRRASARLRYRPSTLDWALRTSVEDAR